MRRFNFDEVRDVDLDAVNIQSIKKLYNTIFWFLIVAATLIEVLLLLLLIILIDASKKAGAGAVSLTTIIPIAFYIFAVPFIAWISWNCAKLILGLMYDVKIMKYKYLTELNNNAVTNQKSDDLNEKFYESFGEPIEKKKFEFTIEELTDLIEKYSKRY